MNVVYLSGQHDSYSAGLSGAVLLEGQPLLPRSLKIAELKLHLKELKLSAALGLVKS